MRNRKAFTLVELLVVVSIIGLLISILLPNLRQARRQAKTVLCGTRLRTLGQGWHMYAMENSDMAPPGRWPEGVVTIEGGRKYRPRWVAVIGSMVGHQPFQVPAPSKEVTDPFGQPGDRQDYDSPVYVCPEAVWPDERNHAYGYNYQFLGNVRRNDEGEYANFPLLISTIVSAGETVLAADCMGTAAEFPARQRGDYENNSREAHRLGNEGWPLDPPHLNREIASHHTDHRSAIDPRHHGKATVIWTDGHTDTHTPEQLGYEILPDGSYARTGNNRLWSPRAKDELPPY